LFVGDYARRMMFFDVIKAGDKEELKYIKEFCNYDIGFAYDVA
jgi:hypothetical protein